MAGDIRTSGSNGLHFDTSQYTELHQPNMPEQRQYRLLRNKEIMMVCHGYVYHRQYQCVMCVVEFLCSKFNY